MKPRTAELWATQDQHEGDRWRLFSAVAGAINAKTVFYPGCYVDIAPSFVFESVTYLDSDRRAPQFFADTAMASIDPCYELTGVVISRSGNYRVETAGLDDYLIPKKPQAITVESLRKSGRGVGYTKSPFAYLFTRTA